MASLISSKVKKIVGVWSAVGGSARHCLVWWAVGKSSDVEVVVLPGELACGCKNSGDGCDEWWISGWVGCLLLFVAWRRRSLRWRRLSLCMGAVKVFIHCEAQRRDLPVWSLSLFFPLFLPFLLPLNSAKYSHTCNAFRWFSISTKYFLFFFWGFLFCGLLFFLSHYIKGLTLNLWKPEMIYASMHNTDRSASILLPHKNHIWRHEIHLFIGIIIAGLFYVSGKQISTIDTNVTTVQNVFSYNLPRALMVDFRQTQSSPLCFHSGLWWLICRTWRNYVPILCVCLFCYTFEDNMTCSWGSQLRVWGPVGSLCLPRGRG